MIPETNITEWSLTAPWVTPDTGPLDMAAPSDCRATRRILRVMHQSMNSAARLKNIRAAQSLFSCAAR